MFDDFLYRNRWVIGAILIIIIISGSGLIYWERSTKNKKITENQAIAELKNQNEILREQLSQGSQKTVAGANDIEDVSDKINLNTATSEELDTLPNIGPARADDIIAYREKNGGFKTIEELKNIKGIGDKYFEDLKDLVTIGN